MAELATVDMPAVEVLSTGGPVHGGGSPPEGDFYTRDDLERIAAANIALAAEIKPPNKIGHSDAQTLVKNSALPAATPGEMPAVGWLDGATARVVDDGDGAKLVMDAKAVPAKFSELIKAGAYRTRSVELSRVTSQISGDVYDWVVTGLAWLGAKLPAVQTLDDVIALYESRQMEHDDNVRAYVVFAADDGPAVTPAPPAATGTVVWDPEAGFQDLRDDVSEALNGQPTGGMNEPRFWVYDVAVSGDRALVQDYYGDGDDGYVIPFTQNADGTITIAPSSDWVAVEQGWIAASKQYAKQHATNFRTLAESRPMEITLTDEQATAVREQLGLEADAAITPEVLVEASTARANELAAAKAAADEADTRRNEASDLTKTVRKLEADLKVEQTKRYEMERDTAIEAAVRDGRIDPADESKWAKRYDANPELTAEIMGDLTPDPSLVRELGRDDDGDGDEIGEDDFARDFERRFGQADPLKARQ